MRCFPTSLDLRPLTSLDEWTAECEEKVAVGVGAIPSFEPVTDGEKNVYAVARKVFASKNVNNEKRLFLEMCYKVSARQLNICILPLKKTSPPQPRRTIMIGIAEDAGWTTVGGRSRAFSCVDSVSS